MSETIRATIAAAEARLRAAGWPGLEARIDADVLARHVLACDRASLLLRRDEAMPPDAVSHFEHLITRRSTHEPVAHLTGVREFYGRDFQVSPAVLVPRPETELIVDRALAHLQSYARDAGTRVADVCTGSGILAVTIAAEHASAQVVATDLSPEAIAVARVNVHAHGVADRVRLVEADLLGPCAGPFDLIVANPPYVPTVDAPNLSPDVRDYEPALALFGGRDGLEVVRRLIPEAAARLAPGGLFLMEFGAGQGYDVAHCATDAGFGAVELLADLQGHDRVLVGRLRVAP